MIDDNVFWAIRSPAGYFLCGTHCLRKDAQDQMANDFGYLWQDLYRMGYRAVKVRVIKESDAPTPLKPFSSYHQSFSRGVQ